MRVLFLSQIVPYPPHGGVLQRGYNLLRELGRHAEVSLLAFVHPDVLPTPEAVDESCRALREFCADVEVFPLWPKASRLHKLAGFALGACSSSPFSVVAHRSRDYAARVGWHLEHRPVDLVHVDTLGLGPFVGASRSYAAVLTHHNVESVLMQRRADVETRLLVRQFLSREAHKLREAEAQMAHGFDVNIVVSAVDEAVLHDRLGDITTEVVPNGVDIDYFTPGGPGTGADLIYTGGMNMFANRDAVTWFLDEIWPIVSSRRPDARFFAVGQDPPADVVARASADPRIVVTNYVSDIRPFVRQSSVYVVPLRVGGGTRLKVLDAMACGKALVSTSIGCEGIDVRDDEHLLMADDPQTFAERTLQLLDDPGRRASLGAAARLLVENRYAWPVVGRSLLAAYERARAIHAASRAPGAHVGTSA